MRAEIQQVLEAAMQLSDRERAQLVSVLVDSLDEGPSEDEILAAWVAEAKRRLEDIRAGRSATTPVEEVLRKARAMIERAKPQASVG